MRRNEPAPIWPYSRDSEVPAAPAETLLDSKRQDVITVQMDLNNMTRARGRIIIFYTLMNHHLTTAPSPTCSTSWC